MSKVLCVIVFFVLGQHATSLKKKQAEKNIVNIANITKKIHKL